MTKVEITEELKVEMKEEAIKRLKKIGVMPQVIQAFEEGKIQYSEYQNEVFPAKLMDAEIDEDLMDVIRRFESKEIGMVYHAIKEYMPEGGPRYSLLYVTKYKTDWLLDEDDLEVGNVYAYVSWWEDEICQIKIKQAMGGIVHTQ